MIINQLKQKTKIISKFKKGDNNKIEKEITPKKIKHSGIYDDWYHPKNLFIEKSYYCSKKGTKQYIEFEFDDEYYFLKFEIIFHEKYNDCIPNYYSIKINDFKKRRINSLVYETKKNVLNYIENIDEKCKYIRFNFNDNYGGDFIIIKKMKFFIISEEE